MCSTEICRINMTDGLCGQKSFFLKALAHFWRLNASPAFILSAKAQCWTLSLLILSSLQQKEWCHQTFATIMLNYFNHQLQSEITPLHSYNQVWPQKMCDFRNGSITACVFGFLGWNISETGSSGLSSEECFPVKNCEFWIRDIFWIQAWSAKGNSRNGNNQKKSTVGVIFESFCTKVDRY